MPQSVYLETSIISYLAARPSRDLVTAAHQQVTHQWWATRRSDFEVFVSELVHAECAAGDPEAAARRAAILQGIPSLDITPLAETLAEEILRWAHLPATARADALHIAIAVSNGVDYLVTWNVTHIANAERRSTVERACRMAGYEPPTVCTPDELLGEEANDV
jgi:predicted nucleic acid-binding protein